MLLAAIGVVVVLSAQATGYGRAPDDCTPPPLEGGRSAVVWQRVKSPPLRRYCERVAGGLSKLASEPGMPNEALRAALEAEDMLPGRAPAKVLEARAHLRLDHAPLAYAALREAVARRERSLDDPPALLALARAAARTGHGAEALQAYGALLASADALPPAERSAAYVEAGMLLLAAGPSRLADAVVTLRQARRVATGDLQLVATVALALALDRGGDAREARAILDERTLAGADDAIDAARAKRHLGPSPTEPEALALRAMSLEGRPTAQSREAWRSYFDAAVNSPWRGHAKEKRDRKDAARGAK